MRFSTIPLVMSAAVITIPASRGGHRPAPVPASPPPLFGFTAQSSAQERNWEERFRQLPDPARMRADMQRLSARPHNVGSPYDHANAEWLLQQFRDAGWDAHIEQFDVLFPTPKERVVELVAPTHFTARLAEPAVPGDPTSSQTAEQLPTYNAYSGDGDVTAPLVYVNYGTPADYVELARQGVSVKGAIVIARYGESWRGIKPKVAAEHGAVGCIIYSDPRDDGYTQGDTFPAGPWRPPYGVQRGSVMDMPLYTGDPLTPGVGATKNAKRLPLKDAATLMRIPVLPISYADARPLLAAIDGRVAPDAWQGGLPITYHIGPGAARVHLVVRSNWDIKPIYDVIGVLHGATHPDEWVIRGNHHDAWVNGAEDPVAGQVALLAEMRALGILVKQGWRPQRTIVYAAWDGEEPGLLGSTEWAEEHAAELQQKAAAYLNSDTNDRGYLDVEGSHILQKLINGVADDVPDPEAGISVGQRRRLRMIHDATPARRAALRAHPDLPIGALGSGSDYTAFLQHLGIPSMNLGFGGEADGGIYHSIYDDFYWYMHFSDSSFVYGKALAQTMGTTVMRLADADVLPYDYTELASTVREYTDQLETLAATEAAQIAETRRELADGTYRAIEDPRHPTQPPVSYALAPHLNFAPMQNGVDALTRAAKAYDSASTRALEAGRTADFNAVNADLITSEHLLTSPAGLPKRPWYKHLLYAPGLYTGYGVKTVPGVREAIEQKDWALADQQIVRVGAALQAEAALVQKAADALRK